MSFCQKMVSIPPTSRDVYKRQELTGEPDLTLGRLVDDVEIVHHDAIAGVQQVSHYVPIEHRCV